MDEWAEILDDFPASSYISAQIEWGPRVAGDWFYVLLATCTVRHRVYRLDTGFVSWIQGLLAKRLLGRVEKAVRAVRAVRYRSLLVAMH